jgi:MYXO-CTERM domain-containing protein
MRSNMRGVVGAVASVALASVAMAQQQFGTLSYGAGAGSTPISWQLRDVNDNSGFIYTNTAVGSSWLTIGLKASNYYGVNEAPVYMGNSTYQVQAGQTAPSSATTGWFPTAARWGVRWSVSMDGARSNAALSGLWWSMRIVSPTAGANWGSLSAGMVNLGTDTQSYAINGWSPSFGFLGLNSASSGGPAGAWNGLAFNPNTQGNYTFRIEVRQGQFGSVLGSTDMTVSVVPAPGAIALLGVAGLVGGRRRKA